MGEEIHMEISIPTDDDGYALLQCEHCSNFFKAIPSENLYSQPRMPAG